MKWQLSPFQWASFSFFGFFCAYGVILPFLPVWLKAQGYDTDTIGLLVALGFLFRFSGGMFFSQRIRRLSQLIPFMRGLSWLSILVLVGLNLAGSQFWLLLPMLALFHLLNGGSMPIGETIASTWNKQIGIDYGKSRLFGSLAFVVGSVLTGYLIGNFGESVIIWTAIGFLILLSTGQMLPPSQGFSEPENHTQTPSPSYWQIFKQPTVCRMLIAMAFLQAGHAAYYTYSTIYWQSAGISPEITSLFWGLAVSAEIGLFFVAKRFFTATKISHLMMIATVGAMIRWAIVANSTSIGWIALSQILHALSFALAHFAMVRFISTQASNQTAKLQALYFGLASCAFMALFTYIAGVVYKLDPVWSFTLMIFVVLPALFIVPKRFPAKLQSQAE